MVFCFTFIVIAIVVFDICYHIMEEFLAGLNSLLQEKYLDTPTKVMTVMTLDKCSIYDDDHCYFIYLEPRL